MSFYIRICNIDHPEYHKVDEGYAYDPERKIVVRFNLENNTHDYKIMAPQVRKDGSKYWKLSVADHKRVLYKESRIVVKSTDLEDSILIK